MRFRDGLLAHEKLVVHNLLQLYLNVESLFGVEGRRYEDVMESLREKYRDDLDKIVEITLSHSKVRFLYRLPSVRANQKPLSAT